jgi:myosin heavy subunit
MVSQGFAVRHYAATVPYVIEGFREKNMDAVEDTLREAVQSSTCAFTAALLGPAISSPTGVPHTNETLLPCARIEGKARF